MKLFSVIFQQYPAVVVAEFRQTSPHSTNRQKLEGQKTTGVRLQIEAFIEEQISKLAGIDVEKLMDEAKKEFQAGKTNSKESNT
jgi:hypothetical protein